MSVRLGNRAKDSITGFEGIVTARSEYLYGCVRVLIEPRSLTGEGKPIEGAWFDEQRISLESEAKIGGPARVVAPVRDPK